MTRMNDTDLDAALARWATADRADPAALDRLELFAEETAALAPVEPSRPGRWRARYVAGAGIAASAVLALLFARPEAVPLPEAAPSAAPGDPGASYALLYTPTIEEDYPL